MFVSLSVFTNYIFDFEYANNHPIEMLASFFDYYLAVFSMCVLVFLVSLYVRRVVASVICIILSIVSICVCNTTSGIFRVLPVNHIVKNVKYTGTKEYVLYIIPAILLCLIFYFVCVWKLKNKDFCGGRWDG